MRHRARGRLLLPALAAALAGCAAPPQPYLFGAALPAIEDATPAVAPRIAMVAAAPAAPADGGTPQPSVAVPATPGIWPRIARAATIPEPDWPLDAGLLQAYAARPDAIARALERGAPYLRQIVHELDRRGLPAELALLPVIESSYEPTAVSPAAAAGIWQLMPQTAREQGLRVDWLRDERHDPLPATAAALDFLSGLHRRLGDWHLVLAAYNCGEGCVVRALARARAAGQPPGFRAAAPFLPQETQAYVPRFLALRTVLRDPTAWRVALPAVDGTPPILRVRLDRDADLDSVARAAGAPPALVAELNGGVRRQVLLGDAREVWLPQGHALRLQAALRTGAAPLLQLKPVHVGNDTAVSELARRHGVAEAQLRRINAIPAALSTVRSGTVFVPLATGEAPGPLALAKLQPLRLKGEEDLAARRLELAQPAPLPESEWLEGGGPSGRLFLPGRQKR